MAATRTRKVPQRMCVGCREMKNKRDLVRVVKTPEGSVMLDTTGKKSGRGAYVCPNQECLSLAVKHKALQKALQQEIPAEVLVSINAQIAQLGS
ncbi:MAG TPA: YlxR family protein [Syntrophomonadaceae bacterium]|nr:YlxR family protein [Syntrophomonadaceae bacterium]